MKLLFFFIQAVLLLGSVFSRSLHRKLDAIEDDTAVIHEAYVVVFDDNISAESKESIIFSLEMSGGTIKYEYYDSFIGIAIEDASDDFLDEILDHPDVIRVMPDSVGQFRSIVDTNTSNWGIDRLDQEMLPLDNKYQSNYTGAGVNIYLIDSGINMNHVEFVGRKVSCGLDLSNESEFPCEDRRGHGTMLAGLAGGSVSGVAREANLISVKVGHRDYPPMSLLIAGCDFVTAEKRKNRGQPMVAVIASGPPEVLALLNQAVERMVKAGVFVTVAAGNTADDACLTSPGVVAQVTTVGSTTILDRVSNESCFGPCVDIFAPSYALLVPWRRDTQYIYLDGTSTAVPLVGGVAALHLQKNPTLKPFQVYAAIRNDAVRHILTGPWDNSTIKNPRMWFRETKTKNLLLNLGNLNEV